MALKEFKTQANELTAPRAVTKPPARSTRSNMQFSASNDPIWEKLEREELNGSPNIDNTGRGLLRVRNHAFEINDRYDSPADKEEAEREENGGLTNAEAYVQTSIAIRAIYETPPSFMTSVTTAPPGHSVGMSLVGKNGVKYTAIHDENGKIAYYDTGTSCTLAKTALAQTMTLPNDDLIDEAQMSNITYKVDKHGNLVERTAEEMQVQLAFTRMDNQFLKLPYQLDMVDRITADVVRQNGAQNDIMFKSAAPAGISTPVTPSAPFTEAVSGEAAPAAQTKSIMFQTPKAKAPWESLEPVGKTSKVSANESKFELTA